MGLVASTGGFSAAQAGNDRGGRIAKLLPPTHREAQQGLLADFPEAGTLGIVWLDSGVVGPVTTVEVERVAPGSVAERKGIRAGMRLDSLQYAQSGKRNGPVIFDRYVCRMKVLGFVEILDLIRTCRPLSLQFAPVGPSPNPVAALRTHSPSGLLSAAAQLQARMSMQADAASAAAAVYAGMGLPGMGSNLAPLGLS